MLTLVVLLVVLPALVVVGGRLYFALQDDTPDTLPAAHVQWTAPTVSELTPMGSWAANELLVTLDRDHLTAFAGADGTQKWQLTPPARQGEPGVGAFCGMSTTTENGLGAVAYGMRDERYGTECAGVVVVDINTGQPVRQVDLPPVHDRLSDDSIYLAVVGDLVIFEQHDAITAINIADGSEAWRHTEPQVRWCTVRDFEASATAVVLTPVDCDHAEDAGSVLVLDPRTGAVKGNTPVPDMNSGVEVVSASPPVVLLQPEDAMTQPHDYLVLDESGRERTRFTATTPAGDLQVYPLNGRGSGEGIGEPHGRYPVVIANGLLVAATAPRAVNEYRDSNRIVAFDLETGEQRWSVALGPKISGVPFATTSDGVLAINDRTYENPSRVVELSFDDGSSTPVTGGFPEEFGLITKAELHWHDGAVYGASMRAENPIHPGAFVVR